jgi:hypothetical protein
MFRAAAMALVAPIPAACIAGWVDAGLRRIAKLAVTPI